MTRGTTAMSAPFPKVPVTKGETLVPLKLPKMPGVKLSVSMRDDRRLAIESELAVEDNAARASRGATVSASVEGDFEIAETGDLLLNQQVNDKAARWIVVDFHQARLINEISLTVRPSISSTKHYFDLKLWGGSIFFSPSPLVREAIPNNTSTPSTIKLRFAEQKTEKILIEFVELDDDKEVVAAIEATLTKLQIKAFSFPSDVSLRIGERQPIFAHQGELSPGSIVPLPDFSTEINTYLEENDASADEGHIDIPLAVSSTSDGTVRFRFLQELGESPVDSKVVNLGFRLHGTVTEFVSSENGQESTPEIKLSLDGKQSGRVLLPIPSDVIVTEASFHLLGRLTETTSNRLGALGSKRFVLAQSFALEHDKVIASIVLELSFITESAELQLAIHPDFDGRPADTPLPDTTTMLSFPVPGLLETLEESVAASFEMAGAVPLGTGKYWIVLATTQGRVTWRIDDRQSNRGRFLYSQQNSSRGWRDRLDPATGKTVSGKFQVRYQPDEPGRFLRLAVGESQGVVGNLSDPADIDLDIASVLVGVGAAERGLPALLNKDGLERPVPLFFSTDFVGELTFSQLLVAFESEG